MVSEAYISKGPVVIAPPHVSKTPLIGTLPNTVGPPPLPKNQALPAIPPMPPQNRPLPPPPPPGILPTPAAQVMLIPGAGVPQMQARPPLMGEYGQYTSICPIACYLQTLNCIIFYFHYSASTRLPYDGCWRKSCPSRLYYSSTAHGCCSYSGWDFIRSIVLWIQYLFWALIVFLFCF